MAVGADTVVVASPVSPSGCACSEVQLLCQLYLNKAILTRIDIKITLSHKLCGMITLFLVYNEHPCFLCQLMN